MLILILKILEMLETNLLSDSAVSVKNAGTRCRN